MITKPIPFYFLTFTDPKNGTSRIGRTYGRKVNAEREAKNLAILGYTDIVVKVYAK